MKTTLTVYGLRYRFPGEGGDPTVMVYGIEEDRKKKFVKLMAQYCSLYSCPEIPKESHITPDSTYGQARGVYEKYCEDINGSILITQGSQPVGFEITKEQITEWLLNPQPTDT
jgi:hypothetical protein